MSGEAIQKEMVPVERGKLPAEAPPPTNGFGVHMMTLRNFVSAGLDMKNKGDYESTVSRYACCCAFGQPPSPTHPR
jgi:hypothetical protein